MCASGRGERVEEEGREWFCSAENDEVREEMEPEEVEEEDNLGEEEKSSSARLPGMSLLESEDFSCLSCQ